MQEDRPQLGPISVSATPADSSSPHPGRAKAFESELVRRLLPRTIDGRSAAARRLVGLIHRLSERVENPSDTVTRSRLTNVAMLIMVSEGLAHRAAAGERIDADEAVRVTHALDRALDRLGVNGS